MIDSILFSGIKSVKIEKIKTTHHYGAFSTVSFMIEKEDGKLIYINLQSNLSQAIEVEYDSLEQLKEDI